MSPNYASQQIPFFYTEVTCFLNILNIYVAPKITSRVGSRIRGRGSSVLGVLLGYRTDSVIYILEYTTN